MKKKDLYTDDKKTVKHLHDKLHVANQKVSNLSRENKQFRESEQTLNDTFVITRQRSAGPNVVEAERSVLSVQENGIIKKTVVKDVYGKLTTRGGMKSLSENEENEIQKKQKLSKNGFNKKQKM